MRMWANPQSGRLTGMLTAVGLVAVAGLVPACGPQWNAAVAGPPLAGEEVPTVPRPALPERERALHLLSRATYGVRPQDVDEVLRVGIDGWLDRQLHPGRLDDSDLEARLDGLNERPGPMTRFIAPAAVPVPPAAPRPASPAAGSAEPVAPPSQDNPGDDEVVRMVAELRAESSRLLDEAGRLEDRARQANATDGARLRQEAAGLRAQSRRLLAHAAPLEQRALEVRRQLAQAEAQMAGRSQFQTIVFVSSRQMPEHFAALKLERAVHSHRQLEEVMTDFWFNHFNVFVNKDRVRVALEDYEQHAIRAHVFGRFEEMLAATARHPAMLMYLDNFLSTAPADAPPAGGVVRGQRRGLNENYARELLELHTLGVDGGYTQQDVIETARAFTGWSIQTSPSSAPGPVAAGVITVSGDSVSTVPASGQVIEFAFEPDQHDRGEKIVLGRTLPAGRGMEDGLETLQMLAHHPATAHHLATKLVRHFVADDPPAALVDEIAGVFRATGGDLREVTRALFTAEAFYDPSHVRAKVKRPFELVASALRVTGADVEQARILIQRLRVLGHLPYNEAAPTGYPVTRDAWVSAGAMLQRLELAFALAEGRINGVQIRILDLLGDAFPQGRPASLRPEGSGPGTAPLNADEIRLIAGALLDRVLVSASSADREALLEEIVAAPAADTPTVLAGVLGLALASPAFQWY